MASPARYVGPIFCISKLKTKMKKFLTTLALAAVVSAPSIAQQERIQPVTDRANDVPGYDMSDDDLRDKYMRMAQSQFEVDMRGIAIESLNLDEEQTADFTPIFLDYTSDKKKLMDRREALVAEYGEEMKENDTEEDEMEETADFIEDYLEFDIRELELRKDYFDLLEDRIGAMNALAFFDLESMYSNRIQRMSLLKTVPVTAVITMIEPVNYSYKPQMDAYNKWNKVYIDGNVTLDHNFTYTGVEKLLNAAEAMVRAEGITVNDFADRKEMIMGKAKQMKENWKSLNHADLAREAFNETAGILTEIAKDGRFDVSQEWVDKLSSQAGMIKPGVKLTEQNEQVNSFFDTAQYIVNELVDQANGMSSK